MEIFCRGQILQITKPIRYTMGTAFNRSIDDTFDRFMKGLDHGAQTFASAFPSAVLIKTQIARKEVAMSGLIEIWAED